MPRWSFGHRCLPEVLLERSYRREQRSWTVFVLLFFRRKVLANRVHELHVSLRRLLAREHLGLLLPRPGEGGGGDGHVRLLRF